MLKIKKIEFKDISKYTTILNKLDSGFLFSENYVYFIATIDKKVCGYGIVSYAGEKVYLKRIFIGKEYRYESNGTALLNFILYWAEGQNIDRIFVKKDEFSEYFFISNGFHFKNNFLIKENILKDKKRKEEGLKGTIISMMVNVFLAIIKIFFGIIGRSKALIADGLNSFSDVITSIIVLISIYYASEPPDKDHPYGHGQLEAISGNSIGLILVITSVLLLHENISSIFKGKELIVPNVSTIYVVIISIIIKSILYIYKIRMGIRLNNIAIIADAKDHKSDVISSTGVLIGIFLAIKINPIFDIIAGIIVALLIGKEGVGIIFDTSNKIMDKQDDELLCDIKNIVMNDKRVYNVHNLMMKSSGNKIFLYFHIRVDKLLTIESSHIIIDEIVLKIRTKYDNIAGITIHTDPVREEI